MIHVFAVEPELVAIWGSKQNRPFFLKYDHKSDTIISEFGIGTPRIIIGYPGQSNWIRRVSAAIETDNDIERSRIIEFARIISNKMLKLVPNKPLSDTKTWLSSAEEENLAPIIARHNPNSNPNVIVGYIDELAVESRYILENNTAVGNSTAQSMANSVSTLLSNAANMFFIDPHFDPLKPSYLNSFKSFFTAILFERRTPIEQIVVITSVEKLYPDFKRDCLERLPLIIPTGMSVSFIRLEDSKCRLRNKMCYKDPNIDCRFGFKDCRVPPKKAHRWTEEHHDRFIHTDIGTVMFSRGLDEKINNSTRLVILNNKEHTKIWSEYIDLAVFTTPQYIDNGLLLDEPIITVAGKLLV